MKRLGYLTALLCSATSLLFVHLSHGATPMLGDAKRILFLGDSITHAGRYVEFIEAYFVTRFPGRQVEILNLGLPSETVSGLSEEGHADGKFPRPVLEERLARVLEKTKPDVVIACYGMNDGIYLPFAEERFAAFSNGLIRLRQQVMARGAKIIHVTPPVFDEIKGQAPGYGETLDRYSDWMLSQRGVGWDVADLHALMKEFLATRRKTEPDFFLSGDGVHVGETGHWIMAKQILLHLGAADLASIESAGEMLRTYPNDEALLKLVHQKQNVLKDAWLTDTGHKRPGLNEGLPLAEAQAKAAGLEEHIRALVTGVSVVTNWPQFRGPDALGVADNPNLPDRWSTNENVAWRIEMPGRGWSAPIVWGERVFVTTVVSEGEMEAPKKGLYFGGDRKEIPKTEHRWLILCYDLKSGREMWRQQAHHGPPSNQLHVKNSYASETPVTDGERVFAYFGNVGLFCYDMDGKQLWATNWPPMRVRRE
jgi:lysophospholipase L1-like esterase